MREIMSKILKNIRNSLLILILLTSTALAGGAKISELKKEEIDNKVTLDDTFVISILQRMIKQRKDAASQFQEANRPELAEKERNEITMLSEFLPEQLSNDDLLPIVKAEIISSEASSMKDIGKVMGSLKPKLLGKADMSTVSRLVKEQLSQ